jgi:hypothetical protein
VKTLDQIKKCLGILVDDETTTPTVRVKVSGAYPDLDLKRIGIPGAYYLEVKATHKLGERIVLTQPEANELAAQLAYLAQSL